MSLDGIKKARGMRGHVGSREKVRSVPPSRRLDPSLLVAFVDYGDASHERPAIVSDPLPRPLCRLRDGPVSRLGPTALRREAW